MHNTSLPTLPRDYSNERKTIRETAKVCENNWVRRTAGVKGIDKRRMEELREEAGVRKSHEEAGQYPAKVGCTCGKN